MKLLIIYHMIGNVLNENTWLLLWEMKIFN